MTLKQKIYNRYLEVIDEKINLLQQVLADLKESGTNETKSTAGDKHETALAMLHIEQENIRGQLHNMIENRAIFKKINPTLYASKIVNGSLVKTSKGYLFISLGLGKATIGNIAVTALSPQSPLGTRLMGLKVTDHAEINNNDYIIESIE